MAEERDIIIDINVEGNVDQAIGEINTQIKENREEIKELNKEYADNATEIAALERENRELATSKRELIKQSNIEKGSLNDLRKQLSELTKQRNNTNLSTKEGREEADKLNKQLAELNSTIKEEEQAGGDFRRNVGNYPELFEQAGGSVGSLTSQLRGLYKVIVGNPILLLATALATLVKLFAESQTGAELFRKTGAALSTTLGILSDAVESLAKALLNPKQAFEDLTNAVSDFFDRFVDDPLGTLEESVNSLSESFVELTKDIGDTTTAAFELEEQLIANEKAIADQEVVVAKSLATQKELNLLIEDQTALLSDRIAAAEEFANVEQEQIDESVRLAQERLDILKAQNDLTNSTEEDIQRVRDAEIELANLQAASFERQVTNQNKLNALLKQNRDEQVAQLQEINDLEEQSGIKSVEINDDVTNALIENTRLQGQIAKASIEDQLRREEALALAKEQIMTESFNFARTIAGDNEQFQKGVALTQIGFDTAQAISALVKSSEENPFNSVTFGGAGIAQLAAGLLRIGTNIGNAINIINSPSSVGSVSSSGGASRGVSSRVSSGQGLANVNASLLGQFSQGAQQTEAGGDLTASSIGQLPAPQVSVTDINTAQNNQQVKVVETSL